MLRLKPLKTPYRVLIVDDHRFVVEMLAQRLSTDAKITIVGTANGGPGALHVVRSQEVDIVLLDMELEDENGIDVAKSLLEIAPQLRIIGLSVHDADQYPVGLLETGGVGFLSKRATGKEIIEGIRRVAAGDMTISPQIAVFLATQNTHGGPTGTVRSLTSKEVEVLTLLAQGCSANATAEALGISFRTVQGHRSRLRRKLQVASDVELCLIAIRWGLVNP